MTFFLGRENAAGHEPRRAALTEQLSAAAILPSGFEAQPVGIYAPLVFEQRFEHEWWATADLVDPQGQGNIWIAVGSHGEPPGTGFASPPDGMVERPDGEGTIYAWRFDAPNGVVKLLRMLLRSDRTYVAVCCGNEASTSAGPTRPTPSLAPDEVLQLVSQLR